MASPESAQNIHQHTANPRDAEGNVRCHCNERAREFTSKQEHSFGRKFYKCAERADSRSDTAGCKFWMWAGLSGTPDSSTSSPSSPLKQQSQEHNNYPTGSPSSLRTTFDPEQPVPTSDDAGYLSDACSTTTHYPYGLGPSQRHAAKKKRKQAEYLHTLSGATSTSTASSPQKDCDYTSHTQSNPTDSDEMHSFSAPDDNATFEECHYSPFIDHGTTFNAEPSSGSGNLVMAMERKLDATKREVVHMWQKQLMVVEKKAEARLKALTKAQDKITELVNEKADAHKEIQRLKEENQRLSKIAMQLRG